MFKLIVCLTMTVALTVKSQEVDSVASPEVWGERAKMIARRPLQRNNLKSLVLEHSSFIMESISNFNKCSYQRKVYITKAIPKVDPDRIPFDLSIQGECRITNIFVAFKLLDYRYNNGTALNIPDLSINCHQMNEDELKSVRLYIFDAGQVTLEILTLRDFHEFSELNKQIKKSIFKGSFRDKPLKAVKQLNLLQCTSHIMDLINPMFPNFQKLYIEKGYYFNDNGEEKF